MLSIPRQYSSAGARRNAMKALTSQPFQEQTPSLMSNHRAGRRCARSDNARMYLTPVPAFLLRGPFASLAVLPEASTLNTLLIHILSAGWLIRADL